ncbi:pseudouridylate synthase PUS7L [Pleurodeles waltl]|uniref:pseudouridylate synthase PUS7L n=1 Tax=Pleurodeles waltl TaxID=8319 RepID=UPI0037097CC9
MEDLNNLSFFQSLACISNHVGFSGVIKNYPQDFVVTEIDMSGQPVSVFTNDISHGSCEIKDKGSLFHAKEKGAETVTLGDGNVHGLSGFDDENSLSGCPLIVGSKDCVDADGEEHQSSKTKSLNSLIETSVLESLLEFANGTREIWMKETSVPPHPTELSLGIFLDKKHRADLHSAIRQIFPFLVTTTKGAEVVVKPNLDYRELCHLVSQEEADSFFRFLDAKLENSKYVFKPDGSKPHRTEVHHFLSKKFGKLVESKSFSNPNIIGQQDAAIAVRFRDRRTSSRKRPAADGPEKQDTYTAFTLMKENLETLEAITYLSSELGVLPTDFSYAGIKDKKAVTYQSMVVRKVTPERLMELERNIKDKRMKVSNIRSARQHIQLGQLKGNHFAIAVRNVRNHSGDTSVKIQERVIEAIQNVKSTGFVNYYGPQRFGQGQNVHSDQIGLALLKEEMVEAVKLLLTPDQVDDPVNKAKRHFLETEDAKGTLAIMPDYKVRERMVLRALNRYGVNHEGCTRGWFSIPHSMRIFYIHAYSSRVWNEAVSYRLKTYGSRVVLGDLVLDDKIFDEKTSVSERVHIVSEEEESSGKYLIHQVVLPMLGYNIIYPSNKVGQWYHEKLAKDGLKTSKFRVPALQLNVPGCYRLIVKNLHNLSYEIVEDTEICKGNIGDINESNETLQTNVSLSLSFDLDSSCYATVCLREIMKCDV